MGWGGPAAANGLAVGGVVAGAAAVLACARRLRHAAADAPARQRKVVSTLPPEIEELHLAALAKGEETYSDPATGFTVFTALAHNRRGYCCGSRCRHCPYGHTNVGKPDAVKLARAEAVQKKKDGKVNKASVYTRGGDKGTSGLFNGERRAKDDLVFEALGAVDECNSAVGIALEYCMDMELKQHLEKVQSKLMDVGSFIATPRNTSSPERIAFTEFGQAEVDHLEAVIDDLNSKIPLCRAFVLPTGGLAASHLHLARTICRRAERTIVRLHHEQEQGPVIMKYMNRLSDFLFVSARFAAHHDGREDVWRPDRGLPRPADLHSSTPR
ncbi:Cob(I)yrinic acid a [Diplonema papillatum]|nr:Cob(I)yrinic acid a [Diplonema papillatum]